ncbi:hypothetical protein BaOVIS_032990 [Babesia ovis]|uniref:Uncharacterized protein n=1 Tax=Babesia ovis TaxID=5869 RepID=A0A9W5TDY3_BABOV|nr:hypothetical protein BaOVIS_032990 [Babesia ovis]
MVVGTDIRRIAKVAVGVAAVAGLASNGVFAEEMPRAVAPEAPMGEHHRPVPAPKAPMGEHHRPVATPKAPMGEHHRPVATPKAPMGEHHRPVATPKAPMGEHHRPVATPKTVSDAGEKEPSLAMTFETPLGPVEVPAGFFNDGEQSKVLHIPKGSVKVYNPKYYGPYRYERGDEKFREMLDKLPVTLANEVAGFKKMENVPEELKVLIKKYEDEYDARKKTAAKTEAEVNAELKSILPPNLAQKMPKDPSEKLPKQLENEIALYLLGQAAGDVYKAIYESKVKVTNVPLPASSSEPSKEGKPKEEAPKEGKPKEEKPQKETLKKETPKAPGSGKPVNIGSHLED